MCGGGGLLGPRRPTGTAPAVSPWLPTVKSTTCHCTAAPPWRPVRGGEVLGVGGQQSVCRWLYMLSGERGACPTLPSTAPVNSRAALAYNTYLCRSPSLSLSPTAPAAPLHIFIVLQIKKKKKHIQLPHDVTPTQSPTGSHTAPLCIHSTAAQKQHQQVSRSSHPMITCVRVCVHKP